MYIHVHCPCMHAMIRIENELSSVDGNIVINKVKSRLHRQSHGKQKKHSGYRSEADAKLPVLTTSEEYLIDPSLKPPDENEQKRRPGRPPSNFDDVTTNHELKKIKPIVDVLNEYAEKFGKTPGRVIQVI